MSAVSFECLGWDSLPVHLLEAIHEKVEEFSDLVRFGAVCKQWQSASFRKLDCYKRVPLLLVPTKDRSHKKRCLYSVTQDKVYDTKLSVPYDRRCVGSSHGWLATVGEDVSITLLNPFSGKTIRLPPVMENPGGYSKRNPFRYEYHIPKVILSHDPSLHPKDYIVVAIYSVFHKLAYIKPGYKSWVYVDATILKEKYSSGGTLFMDVIYHKGKILAVDYYGAIISIDVSQRKLSIPPKIQVVTWRTSKNPPKAYIVVSSDQSEMLLVRRFLEVKDDEIQHVTSRFQVLRLVNDQNEGGGQQKYWMEVENLGGDALFLGDNLSLSLSSSKFPGIRPNCIYYTDDYDDIQPHYPHGPRDAGVYSLEDKSFQSHYKLKPRLKRMPPPIWIMPA